MFLYKITNKISGSIYIGITQTTLKQRFSSHKNCAKRGVKTPLYSAIRSYGIENFRIELLKTFDTRKELEDAEYDKIKILKEQGYNLYNILDGGISYFPIKDKEVWKKKLRKARIGRRPSLGMKHTEENKKYFAKVSREYWDSQKIYDRKKIIKYRLTEAIKKFGISKTHYYRIKNQHFSQISLTKDK